MREAAASSQPALLPNVVDRVPGWRRHLPAAILLLAVAAFLVGFARPHATVSVRSEEATAIIAIDTSRSMGRERRRSRPGSRPRRPSARRFLARAAREVPRLGRRVQHPGAGRRRADDRSRLRRARRSRALRVGEATALGDALATSVKVARGTPPGVKPPRARSRRRRSSSCSPTAQSTAGASKLPEAIRRARAREDPRLHGARSGPRPASSRCRTSAATSSASRCRPILHALRRVGRADRRQATSRRADGSATSPRSTPISSRGSARRTRTRRSRSRSRRPARSCCSAAAPSRRCGSGGCRDPRGDHGARARRGARRWACPPARPQTSARASRSAFPWPAPGSRFRPRAGRVRDRDVEPGLPRGRRRRRRCASQRARRRGRVPGPHRQPGQPRHHDDEVARLQGHLRRAARNRPRATSRSSAASRAAAAARARRRRSRARATVKPGEPITVRVATLRRRGRPARPHDARAAARASACCAARHSVGLYTDGRADARSSSPRSASCACRRGGQVLVSATRRGSAPPACAPRCRCRRSVRSEDRLATRAARAADRAARGARVLSGDRAPARPLRGPLHEHRGARRRRGAASRRWRALLSAVLAAAGADVRGRRARPPRGAARRSPTSRRRSPWSSTCRARCRPRTSSRRASSPPRRRSGASSIECPRKYRVGLVTFSSEPFVASPLTHDREIVLAVAPVRRRRSAAGRRSAMRSRARSSCSSRRRIATTATAPPSTPAAAAGAAAPEARREPPLGDPDALGRRPDARHAGAARGRRARQVVRHPGLHGRARHARTATLNLGGFSRPVPPDPATLRQIAQATGGEFFATAERGAPQRRLRGSRLPARASTKEWRELSFALLGLAALFALAAGALSLLWVQRLP